MNSQMRIRTGLLSRVSTLAILAAAGGFGAVEQAQAACLNVTTPGTITGTHDCATATNVVGNVINNGVIGDPGDGTPGFFVGKGGILGTLTNNNVISGGGTGGEGSTGALTVATNVRDGILNTGIISSYSGNGVQLGSTVFNNSAAMTGLITNSGAITSTLGDGVAAILGTTTGGLLNDDDGTISGGNRGVYVADSFTSWSGGIQNFGQIKGSASAIQIGNIGGEGSVVFSGGIRNESGGSINSLTGPTIAVNGLSFSGGISNDGLITQRDLTAAGGEGTYTGVGIVVFADTFNDGIYNTGTIDGLGGPAIWITSNTTDFNDGITNYGRIRGVDNGIKIEGTNFTGDLNNYSEISATSNSLDFDGSTGDAIYANTAWSGNFNNQGLIQSGLFGDGVDFEGPSYAGNFTNDDRIFGGKGGVVFGNSDTDISDGAEGNAQFRNTGTISGAEFGVRILGDTVDMDFINDSSNPGFRAPGEIVAESGAALLLSAANWTGNITNDGSIHGGAAAMLVGGDFSDGFFAAPSNINQLTDSFHGTITNNGALVGDTVGLYVTAGTYTGDIHNSSSGVIFGSETGAYIEAGTFHGDIVNDGLIEGTGFDTGLHVVAGTYIGDIFNNGTLSSASNALHVEIGNLTGSIVNTGLIQVDLGNTAVLLDIESDATFVNTDGGLIRGSVALNDFVFDGKASHTFIGEDGGIVGSIIGQPDTFGGEGEPINNDFVVVRDGTHYFLDDGSEGGAGLRDLAAFNVDDGGTAVMGASYIGDPNGTGYESSNLDALNVNNGGTLYIDKSTVLDVNNTYVQNAGGTLMYYLAAPGGEGFSDLTGTVVADPLTDYGHIHITGTADLDGTIAAYLDPAFANANPDLEEVQYNDVLTADGGITGDFSTLALLSNSSLFELDEIIDGNTVDLRLTRTALGGIADIGGIVVNTNGPFDQAVSGSGGASSGSCGMASAFGGSCFNRFAANEPGATSVMNDSADDPFNWLRTGVRHVGETSVWGRAIGVWGNTDGGGGVPGSDFNTYGGIVGVDHVFTPILMAGVAGQYTKANIDFDGRPDNADVGSFEAGAYMSYGDTRLYLNANASFIWHNIDIDRFAPGGVAHGDFDGTTISGYAEAGKIFETGEGLRIQPLVSLSYSHLETDAYSETGSAFSKLNVFASDFDSLKGSLGARFAYPLQMDSGRKLVPEARIMWTHEFMDDQSSFLATIQGPPNAPQTILGERFSRDTIVLGAGLTAPISASSTLFIDYDAGLNSDITTHTVSAGFRIIW